MVKSLLPGPRKAVSQTREVQDIQQHVNSVIKGLQQVGFIDGYRADNVTVTTSAIPIAHSLGRPAKGTPLVLQSVATTGTPPVPIALALADDPSKRTSTSSTITATSAAVVSLYWY